MGDFDVDLLSYKNDSKTADFLDQVCPSPLVSQIMMTTHLRPISKTLIDNIFDIDNTGDTISENILATISGHLQQFILFPIA